MTISRKNLRGGALALACAATASLHPAMAQEQTVTVTLENQHFGKQRGNIRSATLEYKLDFGETTILAGPVVARRTGPREATSAGFDTSLYHDWSPAITTRTRLAVAGNDGVLPFFDVAQDLTFRPAEGTSLLAGARLARYRDRDVVFASLGVRQYFKGGSVGYRLTRAKPDGAGTFLAHLADLTLNDGSGRGKTRLWLGYGGGGEQRSPLDAGFAADDYALTIQRSQPLGNGLSLVPALGYTSYDRPGGRISATTVSLGLALDID